MEPGGAVEQGDGGEEGLEIFLGRGRTLLLSDDENQRAVVGQMLLRLGEQPIDHRLPRADGRIGQYEVEHAGHALEAGFESVTGMFDFILTNPPIRAGKAVIYRLFAEAKEHLADDGALILVIRKQQGAASAQKYLQTLFPTVTLLDRTAGFHILQAEPARSR